MTEQEFRNASELIFSDISSEEYRVYEFLDKSQIVIKNPLKLNVSDSGGHRIFTADGISHYIPNKWIHLWWKSKDGEPNFVR